MPEYSFIIYRIYSKIYGAKIKYAKEKNYKISVENILDKVTKKTKIVFWQILIIQLEQLSVKGHY